MPNTVKGLQKDKKGFIWAATESGLVRYDGKAFLTYNHTANGTLVNRITDIALTKSENIYIRTTIGDYTLNEENILTEISTDKIFEEDRTHFSSSEVPVLYSQCKAKYDKNLIQEWAIPALKTFGFFINSGVVYSEGWYLYLNKKNDLVATDSSLSIFNKLEIPISDNSKGCKRKSTSLVVSLMYYGKDIYYRREDSIYVLGFNPDHSKVVLKPVLYIGNIQNINSILPMPEYESYMLGTVADGLYFFQKQSFSTLTVKNSQSNVFYAQAPFGNDGVLTNGGILSPKNYLAPPINFDARFIFQAKSGEYYVMKREINGSGIVKLDKNLRIVKEVLSTNRSGVRFVEMENGSKWFSLDSSFIGQLNNDYSIQWMDRPVNLPAAFYVSEIVNAGDNQIWIAGNKGVVRYGLYNHKSFVIKGIDNIAVRTVCRDTKGVLWIGTYGNGFYAWYNDELLRFPMDKKSYLSFINTFMEDESGHFWISTDHGLFEYSLLDLHSYIDSRNKIPYYYYYDRTAGFLNNQFSGACSPSGIKLGNGKFSLPSLNGLVQFYPNNIKPIFPNSGIFFDKLVVDTTALNTGANKEIRIQHDYDRLQLYISSPYFGNRYNQRFEYSIDQDNKWYDLGNNYIVELGKMPSGRHTVMLRKQAGFGKTGYVTKQIDFIVESAFFETLYFKLIAFAVFCLLLYSIYRLRVRFLVKQKKRLEKEVSQKTMEQKETIKDLEKVVSELEQSKTELQKNIGFKETLAMIIAHDLQSPLRFLSDAMERMHEMNKTADPDCRELSTELRNASVSIHQFVDDFSIWIKKVNIVGKLNLRPVNITALLTELEIFFSELTKTKNNTLVIDTSVEVVVMTDDQLIKIILRNIIDNANKYTEGGKISISLFVKDAVASIKIADTGQGIKPELLEKIRHLIQQPANFGFNGEINGSGYGYRFVTDFSKLLGASLKIESHLNKGTTVILSDLKVTPQ